MIHQNIENEWLCRKNNDWKTMGELFFMCCEDIKDIELSDALKGLLALLVKGSGKIWS